MSMHVVESPGRVPGLRALGASLSRTVGGPARRRVVVLFACVLALDSADGATIGAVAAQLEHSLRISNTQVGLLAAATAFVGALATVPLGVLTDRVNRVRLLVVAIALWSVAMLASGAAGDYTMLLCTRLALGAATAAAGPALASLTGDLFAAQERGRIYGFVLTGELIGAGIGFVISGDVAGALSWRFSFWLLAVPGFPLALALLRLLPEPARGGQSHLAPGATQILAAEDADERTPSQPEEAVPEQDSAAQQAVAESAVQPRDELILRADPSGLPLAEAARYVLRIPTNRILILASGLGYFYFAGVRTFAVVLLRGRFGLSQSLASTLLAVVGVGATGGVLVSGRLADRLTLRGRLDARVLVGAVAFLAATGFFLPGLLSPWLAPAMVLFFLGAAALASPNPPLDAARLDVMHPRLWGRAEGIRTLLRQLAVGLAPLAFGLLADQLGGSAGGFGAGRSATVSAAQGRALEYCFLIMLVVLGAGGLILLRARRTFARDVATATASAEATAPPAAVQATTRPRSVGRTQPRSPAARAPAPGAGDRSPEAA